MAQNISRRQFGALALSGIGTTFLLAGCGTSGTTATSTPPAASTADAFAQANLNFMWWTNPVRTAYTEQILKNYTAAHPSVTVNPQPGEWATYWTKLSTMVAGQNTPDIIQMDQGFIVEYADRGALMDMNDIGTIDKEPLKSTLNEGMIGGKLYGVPTGNNAYAYCANRTLFDKAGVKLPNDKTWTWTDFQEISERLAQGSNGAFAGGEWGAGNGITDLQIWLQQHGELLFTNKGTGYKVSTVESWFQQAKKFFASSGSVSSSTWVNDSTASVQQSSFGTNKVAMVGIWSNQIKAYQQANGGNLILLRPPSVAGTSAKAGMYFKPSMYWSIGATSKYPAQAGALINYFLNDPSAAKLQLVERGVPANPKIVDLVKPLLSQYDQLGLEYLANIKDDVSVVPPLPPKGTSTVGTILGNALENVIYGKSTPSEAAQSFNSQVKSAIAEATNS